VSGSTWDFSTFTGIIFSWFLILIALHHITYRPYISRSRSTSQKSNTFYKVSWIFNINYKVSWIPYPHCLKWRSFRSCIVIIFLNATASAAFASVSEEFGTSVPHLLRRRGCWCSLKRWCIIWCYCCHDWFSFGFVEIIAIEFESSWLAWYFVEVCCGVVASARDTDGCAINLLIYVRTIRYLRRQCHQQKMWLGGTEPGQY